LFAAFALLAATACSPSEQEANARTKAPIAKKSLEPFQADLLDLAFGAASAFPLNPHHKNRARTQEMVVTACFALDQPQRALSYIEKIENWRRGAGYADYAFYCARHGDTAKVHDYLNLAETIAEQRPTDGSSYEWRRDRIRAKIARTLVLLDEQKEADRIAAGIDESELSKIDSVRARVTDTDLFAKLTKSLGSIAETGSFAQVQSVLAQCLQLFDRNYADTTRRDKLEKELARCYAKLPVTIQVQQWSALANIAIDHDDHGKAQEFVTTARKIVHRSRWLPEDHIATLARLARLRFRAGQHEKAVHEADAAFAMYKAKESDIVDMYRAGALRPIAEAYNQAGDRDKALAVYKLAVEASVVNPNSRPRAVDLTETCCSLAVNGIAPDQQLIKRLREVRAGLGDPW